MRWIYACCKQLLDRVIWAYGQKEGLRFTLFRPFNWIGPKLDTLQSARIGSSRAITQLILNLTEGTPIHEAEFHHKSLYPEGDVHPFQHQYIHLYLFIPDD